MKTDLQSEISKILDDYVHNYLRYLEEAQVYDGASFESYKIKTLDTLLALIKKHERELIGEVALHFNAEKHEGEWIFLAPHSQLRAREDYQVKLVLKAFESRLAKLKDPSGPKEVEK